MAAVVAAVVAAVAAAAAEAVNVFKMVFVRHVICPNVIQSNAPFNGVATSVESLSVDIMIAE